MKRFFYICFLIPVLCLSISCVDTKNTEVKLVTAEEMISILESEDVQVIDVRTPEEYSEVHISNAQNIDYFSPTFEEDITKLDKEKPIILYCKGGVRSAKCAKKMEEAGFEKIYDLEGGLSRWQHSDELDLEVKS
ncbi:rhodanese-like domain-containing protein [Winogradskyella vincentii]|uniref:Rhodanese-like domain-containing protein n=1 Tax=Winogradskyella vincentii TaxID=2877122 RepID=A0ABS7XVK6_9FLAO|nr:rhodanese-like domain-containing protein [Winogradskyella vincentii]MCA0151669.1 rhodanese-like domain-containing protein [Winogradskyella vincentii]